MIAPVVMMKFIGEYGLFVRMADMAVMYVNSSGIAAAMRYHLGRGRVIFVCRASSSIQICVKAA